MRIKPWAVTAGIAVCAATALGIVVAANDPATASPAVKALFWVTLTLVAWSVSATMLSVVGAGLPQAVWCGLALAGGLAAVTAAVHLGHRDRRLLGGIVFATLSLSFLIWYRTRGRA